MSQKHQGGVGMSREETESHRKRASEGRQDPGGHRAVWHAFLYSGNYRCKCHMGMDMGWERQEGRPGRAPGPFLQVVGSDWKLKRLLFFLGKLSNDLCTLPSLSGGPNCLGEEWFGFMFICISLIPGAVKDVFVCLLAICTYSCSFPLFLT